MTTPLACDLIFDLGGEGAWNMAVDESLLERARTGVPSLRLYHWSVPTLSVGYFQPLSDRLRHGPSRTRPVVRRASGGGAILHHHELTYSLAMPVRDRIAAGLHDFYYDFHETLAEALTDWGVTAELCDGPSPGRTGQCEPFLCFQRRSKGDLLIGQHKVVGSAQRRHQGALLQHGSILWRRSIHAPELPGIEDLAGQTIDELEFRQVWLQRLQSRLGLDWNRSPAARDEQLVARFVHEKFGEADWTERR